MKRKIVIIGGGPAGYSAAFRAAELGQQVTVVDSKGRLGGACLYRGCIPSKTLLHLTGLRRQLEELEAAGFPVGEKARTASPDTEKLRAHKNKIIGQLSDGLAGKARQMGIETITGFGRLGPDDRVEVIPTVGEGGSDTDYSQGQTLEYDACVLAGGTAPWLPDPFAKIYNDDIIRKKTDPLIWTSREALEIPRIPRSLTIIGGGYIGLELGQVYAGLGSQVTLVEVLPEILNQVDPEVRRPLLGVLEDEFHALHTSAKITSARPGDDGDGLDIALETKNGSEIIRAERVLVAAGRRPAAKALGIGEAGIQTDRAGYIMTDAQMRTSNPAVFAVGDIRGGPQLAHKGYREGKLAAEVIAGFSGNTFDQRAIPAVAYTRPEIATVGLSEAGAKEAGFQTESARFPWRASGRALANGVSNGLTKIISEKETGRILGGAITGEGAGELIAELALALEMGATVEDLTLTIHPHPGLSETIMDTAEKIYHKNLGLPGV